MKQKDIFVGISFFTLAIGLGFLVTQTPPMNADQLAQMEPAAGEEAMISDMEASSMDEAMETETDGTMEDSISASFTAEESADAEIEAQAEMADASDMAEPAPMSTMPEETKASVEEAEETDGTEVSSDYSYTIEEALSERSIGSPNAPHVVYNYSSLSCPHCAEFHIKTFPKIKEEYIDTGKIRWVFKPFPTNQPALMGITLAHCVNPRRFERIMDLLYNNQRRWAFAKDPHAELFNLVRIAGIDFQFYQKCMSDDMLSAGLVSQMQEASAKHGISGTPTFLVDEEYRISGALSFDAFKSELDSIIRVIESEKEEQE